MNSLSDDSILGKRVTQQDIGNDHRDIISFLAIAHNCDVDILPILWQPTLNVLGWGATSLINQSLINVHTSFAFKRTSSYLSTNSISGRDVSKANFGSLITEVLILRHPLIRNHANIIDLEGICWDSDGVWPVLVFQRAHLGDLQSFTNYKYDQSASLEIELGLCTDISMAVMALHDCNIVHGDIKPQNVLIFKDGKGGLQAKLTDFGHSCLGKDENDPIYLPRSRPWNDPNWDDECFEIHEAKRMDIYSLGMVCLFVLCHSTHTWSSSEPTTTIPGYDRPISFQSIWEERNIDVFEDLKWRDLLPGIAHSLVSTIVSLDPARQNSLAMFFSLTLAKKPDSRQPDCRKLIQLLNPNQIDYPSPSMPEEDYRRQPHCNFSARQFLYQLGLCDLRVRTKIATLIKAKASKKGCKTCALNIVCLYRLIHVLGLGDHDTLLDENESTAQLQDELRNEITAFKQSLDKPVFHESGFRKLKDEGYIRYHDLAIEYRKSTSHSPNASNAPDYRKSHQFNKVKQQYESEITRSESVLGSDHWLPQLLKSTLSGILETEGLYEEAERLATEILTTNADLGTSHPKVLKAMASIASILYSQDRCEEAGKLQETVFHERLKGLGATSLKTLESMDVLAKTYISQGKMEESEKLLSHILAIKKEKLGKEHQGTVRSMVHLASTYNIQGRWKESEELYKEALIAYHQQEGATHPNTLLIMSNLATLYQKQGKWSKAKTVLENAWNISKRELGETHPDTLIIGDHLSIVLCDLGYWSEADKLGREVLKSRREELGDTQKATLISICNLASIHCDQGQWNEAELLLLKALDEWKTVLSETDPWKLNTMGNLAVTLGKQERWEEAEDIAKRVLTTAVETFGKKHPQSIQAMSNLAFTYWGQDLLEKTEELCSEALGLIEEEEELSDTHPYVLALMSHLAMAYCGQRKFDKATEIQGKILAKSKEELGKRHPNTLIAMSNLAQTYYDQRLLDKAEALQLEVLENWRNAFGEAHPDVLKLMRNLAQTYCRQKRWKEAEEIERNVLARRETQGKTKPSTLDTMARLAVIYTHQQRWKEAEELEVEILVRRGEAAGKTQAPPNVRPTLGAAAASEGLL